MRMYFLNSFDREYSGETAEEVIETLYQNSRRGMGDISMDDWWAYQTKLWKTRYGMNVPDRNTPNAYEGLLKIMVQVGALTVGRTPENEEEDLKRRRRKRKILLFWAILALVVPVVWIVWFEGS